MNLADRFTQELLLLCLGFIFTGVFGTALGAILQYLSWRGQWKIQMRQRRTEDARALFDDISRLMDRRLFRIKQLHLWCARQDRDRLAIAMDDYRKIVFEWNDSVNRNLAMLQFYFSAAIREEFDNGVGKDFVEAGALVERQFRDYPSQNDLLAQSVDGIIGKLRAGIYSYNLSILAAIGKM